MDRLTKPKEFLEKLRLTDGDYQDSGMINHIADLLERYHGEQLLLPTEIYVTYDKIDGEVFCAFVDKEQCERDAKECGCGMQTNKLIPKQNKELVKSIDQVAIDFTTTALSNTNILLSEDYKIGFKEGIQKYLENNGI